MANRIKDAILDHVEEVYRLADWVMPLLQGAGIGVLVSGIGAAVGICGLIYKIIKDKQKRSRLVLEVGYGGLAWGSELGEYMLIFKVSNPVTADKGIILSSIKIDLGGRQSIVFPDLQGEKSLPCVLSPGDRAMYWVEYRQVVNTLKSEGYNGIVKVNVVAKDAEGKSYKKRRVGLDIDEWADAS